jgi:TetR/AcrR family transcriptional regulator, regulator of cefoperazone and chloramphenicol sensitivity
VNIQRKDAALTRGKLLASAGEVFADKGYRAATIAEICKRAGANIASVNYHFRTKEQLYVEAWRYAFNESIEAHPPDGGVSADAPPEERLRGQIRALINRIADRGNREFRIMQQEIFDPTDLLEGATRELLDSLHISTQRVVRELLGPCVPEEQAGYCEISIVNQCISPMLTGRSGKGIRKNKESGDKRPMDIEAYAGHVFRFSLAGIRAVSLEFQENSNSMKKTKTGS